MPEHQAPVIVADWTERHRPRGLADLVGNGPSIKKLAAWAEAWQTGKPPAKRAVVLAGPPGTGKTSAALALAADMGWPVIELNASDARNADAIKRVAGAGAVHQTFGSDGSFQGAGNERGRKLIILDEADNLTERLSGENAAGGGGAGSGKDLSDKGGKAAILATIRETKQPIILIVNDLYALTRGAGSALKGLAETLKFTRVNVRSIPKALANIARAEGIDVEPAVFEAIAGRAGGDLRAAVRDLESICRGRTTVTSADLASLGDRDATGNMFDHVAHILKQAPFAELRREGMSIDATPEDLVLWVDENLPKEYKHPEDLVAGYEALSRADVFLGRTRRKQHYRLWAYAGDLARLGVSAARQHPKPRGGRFEPLGFPQWLSKMGRTKGIRQSRDQLTAAIAVSMHMSRSKARLHQFETIARLCQMDEPFAISCAFAWDLTDAQVEALLGPAATTARVKAVRDGVKQRQAEEAEASLARAKAAAVGGTGARQAGIAAPGGGLAGFSDDTEDEVQPAEPADEAGAGVGASGEAGSDDGEGHPEGDSADAARRPPRPSAGDGQRTLF